MDYKYPSIDGYYKYISKMVGKPVVITEKLDGSNFSVVTAWESDTRIKEIRSRSQVLSGNNKMFSQAEAIIAELRPEIQDAMHCLIGGEDAAEIVWYFELIGSGIQKRVDYTKYFVGKDYAQYNNRTIALIDILMVDDQGNQTWVVWSEIRRMAQLLGLYSPDYTRVDKLQLSLIDKMIEEKDIEGYVIRGETEDEVLYDRRSNLMRCKVKTNDFLTQENKKGRNKTPRPEWPPEIMEFMQDRINFGRLSSIYSHGHEELIYDMPDMKYLPDLMVEDIKSESPGLWDEHDPIIIRKVVCRLLPPTLKEYLLERNMEDNG